MAKLSSSNGIEKFPKLRFPEFKEPYRSARLGEIAILINRTDPKSAAPITMFECRQWLLFRNPISIQDITRYKASKNTSCLRREN